MPYDDNDTFTRYAKINHFVTIEGTNTIIIFCSIYNKCHYILLAYSHTICLQENRFNLTLYLLQEDGNSKLIKNVSEGD